MFAAIKKQIPNLLTMGNLCCGVFAILLINHSRFELAAWFILLAVVFDFFDGFLARLLKVSGELGKQLDSLADLVTFGIAPAMMLYVFAIQHDLYYSKYAFLLLVIFSAYRLAKFNIDTRQSTSFIGVPTPITGIMVASWAFIEQSHPAVFNTLFTNPFAFTIFCVTISLLLVSEIPLPALKLKKGTLKDYRQQLMLLVFSVVSVALFKWLALPIIYSFYVLSSVIINFATNKKE
jgi:CDP-diacylglycerol---serine O-phosphatidyltransferase